MGTTTCALALSNYMNNKLGLKTAYLELNGTNEISSINKKKEDNFFTFCGIPIYPSVTLADLGEIFSLRYTCFILDMGRLNPHTISTFWRSDLCIIMCSLSPWQEAYRKDFKYLLPENNMIHQEKVLFLANLGIKEQLAAFHDKTFRDVRCFPYLPNPFRLTPKDWAFFETLLTGKIYHRFHRRGHTYDNKNGSAAY